MTSRRITSSLRSQIDSVARYGGEEFVVVLPETPPTGARVVAEKARAAMSSDAILVDDQTPPLRVTVLCLPEDHYRLLLTAHHIAMDGVSLAVVCRELSTVYAALRAGDRPQLPPLPLASEAKRSNAISVVRAAAQGCAARCSRSRCRRPY
jgi:hypothetical protein